MPGDDTFLLLGTRKGLFLLFRSTAAWWPTSYPTPTPSSVTTPAVSGSARRHPTVSTSRTTAASAGLTGPTTPGSASATTCRRSGGGSRSSVRHDHRRRQSRRGVVRHHRATAHGLHDPMAPTDEVVIMQVLSGG